MRIKRIITSTFATGALLLSAFATPAFADTTLTISGNGADSTNTTTVKNDSSTTVVQDNFAHVRNNVDADANTGKNDANANTGGSVAINTGNATSNTTVSTLANVNSVDMGACATCGGNNTVTISGNGAHSTNTAKLKDNNETSVFQDNFAHVRNNVDADANTGKNDANANTGGSVAVNTGSATTNVTVNNQANANVASVGAGTTGAGNTTGILISGNGAGSTNTVKLVKKPSILIVQGNSAWIRNNVDADANTGKNDANANTGGSVAITTGPASENIGVTNMANFNAASVDCGCLTSNTTATISGNGTDSHNAILATIGGLNSIFQGGGNIWYGGYGNSAWISNWVDGYTNTGKNDANANTGIGESSVIVNTGGTTDTTNVSNSTNVNLVGPFSGLSLPTMNGLSLSFNLNLASLMGLLHQVV